MFNFSLKMNIVEVVYICLVIAVVHCETTLEIPKPLQEIVDSISANNNVTINPMTDGEMRFLPSQNGTAFKSITLDSIIKTNGTAHTYRRLIINKGLLRSKKKDKKETKAETLLFEEYNDDGSTLLSVNMKTLDDVAKFFQDYLHTDICHVVCKPKMSS